MGVDPGVFMLFDPFNNQMELPIQLYDFDDHINYFKQISYSVKINDIERIGMESVAKSTSNDQENWCIFKSVETNSSSAIDISEKCIIYVI